MMEDLDKFRIKTLPSDVYYIPEFITTEEEEYLIRQVNAAPKPKWTQLSNRRLQNWGGLPHPKGMIPEKIPEWLNNIFKRVAETGVFEDNFPNHVLVNEYLPGQGIMPHEDGPLYYPTVSNVTLGSYGVLDFYRPANSNDAASKMSNDKSSESSAASDITSYKERCMGSMLLERRSLFLMREDMYKLYLHGIKEIKSDTINEYIMNLKESEAAIGDELERGTRISLTIRFVPKVLKNKLFFGNKR